jgi:phosphatidylserine/phosphatidylglycerophosphate/cardiolipin synthase-like enzyme
VRTTADRRQAGRRATARAGRKSPAKNIWGSAGAAYFDPRALDLEGPGGVLHAKAVVADEKTVFVTSANLTEAALDRNIELGVLIRDRAFALTIGGYFRNLIDAIYSSLCHMREND